MAAEDKNFYLHVRIPFKSEREAEIAYDVLRVDEEPKRSGVIKNLELENSTLIAKLTSPGIRQLRVAVGSFFNNLILTMETMDQFCPALNTIS